MWIVRAQFCILIACCFSSNCVLTLFIFFSSVLMWQEIHLAIMNGNCHQFARFFSFPKFRSLSKKKYDMILRCFVFYYALYRRAILRQAHSNCWQNTEISIIKWRVKFIFFFVSTSHSFLFTRKKLNVQLSCRRRYFVSFINCVIFR